MRQDGFSLSQSRAYHAFPARPHKVSGLLKSLLRDQRSLPTVRHAPCVHHGRIQSKRSCQRGLPTKRPSLISSRSSCQRILPRSLRISCCFLVRIRTRRASSTTAFLVGKPVAFLACSISLSLITIFVRMS